MIAYFKESYSIPSRFDVENTINSMLNNCQGRMIKYIANIKTKLSFCIDSWTNKEKQKFIGVTMSYIENSAFKSMVLDMLPCDLDNGIVLKDSFLSILKKLKCEHKLFSVISDNGKRVK